MAITVSDSECRISRLFNASWAVYRLKACVGWIGPARDAEDEEIKIPPFKLLAAKQSKTNMSRVVGLMHNRRPCGRPG